MTTSLMNNVARYSGELFLDVEVLERYIAMMENYTILCQEELVVHKKTWIQHEVHWSPICSWWLSAHCHPDVAMTIVIVIHEVYCISSTFSTSFHIGH